MPSESEPFPGTTNNYFSGGYITLNHTCYSSGVEINGLHMELNYAGLRDRPLIEQRSPLHSQRLSWNI